MRVEMPGRGWMFLVLAGVFGFVGRDGIATSFVGLLGVLLVLFVVAFCFALAFSVLSERAATRLPSPFPDSRKVNPETAFEST